MKVDTFANRLQKAIDLRGYKQIDIANKTKISKSLLNKYLAGVTEAKQDKLTLLAQVLDVDETWLMGYDVPMINESEVNDLQKYLENIEYDDIENIVKNDNEHQLIKLIDTIDVITRIYADNMITKSLYINSDKLFQVADIVRKNDMLSHDIGLNEIIGNYNYRLKVAKECKFIYFLKKYYTKNDILLELDNRNKEAQIQFPDTKHRIELLKKYLDNTTKELNQKANEKLKNEESYLDEENRGD